MLSEYVRKSNIAAIVWAVGLVLAIAIHLMVHSSEDNMPKSVVLFLGVVVALAWWYGLYAYAKAKGYPGIVGILLSLFSIIGLAILLFLKDKTAGLPVERETSREKLPKVPLDKTPT
jgi:drug/metabolite transporter (DMT)-like permease